MDQENDIAGMQHTINWQDRQLATLRGELDTHRFLARVETKKNQALIEQLKQEKLDLEQFKNQQIKELMIEIKEWKAEAQRLSDRLSEEGY